MKIYTVSELTTQIKELLEDGFPGVWVEGEVTNYRPSSSGHLYFSLKDEFALINCIIWKEDRTITTVELQNGKKIRIYGVLRVYAKGGTYNLQVERVYPIGIGELQIKFEELKRKLKVEGLFETSHKKPLPKWVERIGVVTAMDGAAVQDIIKVARRRYPGVEIIIRASPVQGDGAAQEIARGIKEFNMYSGVDLLIVGRGGGSIEDLWAFNEEVVARAIYDSTIPVISAVGHDIDWTIADFVADVRAPTPSAAAEIAVRNSEEILDEIDSFEAKMEHTIKKRISMIRDKILAIEKSYGINRLLDLIHEHWQTLDELGRRLGVSFTHPLAQKVTELKFVAQRFNQVGTTLTVVPKKRLDEIVLKLKFGINGFLKQEEQSIKIIESKLGGVNPHAILERGYSICYKLPERTVVKTSKVLSQKDKVEVEFSDGKVQCEVTGIQP